MSLHEYKDVIAAAAGIFTVAQFFSPAIMCWGIVKQGSSNHIAAMPFLGGTILSALFLQNSFLMGDQNMININILTLSLSVLYLVIYWSYSEEKVKFYIKFGKAIIFLAVLIGYAQREEPSLVQFRFGLICTIILLFFIAAPLFSLSEILRTKNTDALPMPLITSGTFVALAWFLYGMAINDTVLKLQNAIALLLNVVQLVVYASCKFQKPAHKFKKY